MKFLAGAAAMAAATMLSGLAQAATTIDFDELRHDSVVKVYSAPILADGFSFTSDQPINGIGVWGIANNADPDGATIVNWSSLAITVRRTDGDFFSLASLDIADTYNAGAPSELLFTFFDGVKTTTQAVTLDRVKGMQTVALEQKRLQWFSYAQIGSQGAQVDNVVVDAAVNAGVPEPATWGLMILGFGTAGTALRRRRFAIA